MSWKVCPRCGVSIVEGQGVVFSHSQKPQTTDFLASKVCQWAYAQDQERDGGPPSGSLARPVGCINPTYDPTTPYPSFLDEVPSVPMPHPDEQ